MKLCVHENDPRRKQVETKKKERETLKKNYTDEIMRSQKKFPAKKIRIRKYAQRKNARRKNTDIKMSDEKTLNENLSGSE